MVIVLFPLHVTKAAEIYYADISTKGVRTSNINLIYWTGFFPFEIIFPSLLTFTISINNHLESDGFSFVSFKSDRPFELEKFHL